VHEYPPVANGINRSNMAADYDLARSRRRLQDAMAYSIT
jgi:hypothetical protein